MASAVSAADGALVEVEEFVKCTICSGLLEEPKTLPCLHSFCKECLNNTRVDGVRTNKLRCPQCRSLFTVEIDQPIQELRCDFVCNTVDVITTQRQAIEMAPKCTRCENPAAWYCCSCDKHYMCDACCSFSHNWQKLRKHVVLTLDELCNPANRAKLKRQLHCTIHGEKIIKFFCKTCKKLICRSCADVDHARPKHNYELLSDVAKNDKELLKCYVADLELQLTRSHNAADILAKNKEQLKDDTKKVYKEIDEEKTVIVETLILKIDAWAKSRSTDVKNYEKRQSDAFEKRETNIKNEIERVNGTRNFITILLENGTDEEVFSSKKQALKSYQEIMDELLDFEQVKPIATPFLKYHSITNGDEMNSCITSLSNKLPIISEEIDIIPPLSRKKDHTLVKAIGKMGKIVYKAKKTIKTRNKKTPRNIDNYMNVELIDSDTSSSCSLSEINGTSQPSRAPTFSDDPFQGSTIATSQQLRSSTYTDNPEELMGNGASRPRHTSRFCRRNTWQSRNSGTSQPSKASVFTDESEQDHLRFKALSQTSRATAFSKNDVQNSYYLDLITFEGLHQASRATASKRNAEQYSASRPWHTQGIPTPSRRNTGPISNSGTSQPSNAPAFTDDSWPSSNSYSTIFDSFDPLTPESNSDLI